MVKSKKFRTILLSTFITYPSLMASPVIAFGDMDEDLISCYREFNVKRSHRSKLEKSRNENLFLWQGKDNILNVSKKLTNFINEKIRRAFTYVEQQKPQFIRAEYFHWQMMNEDFGFLMPNHLLSMDSSGHPKSTNQSQHLPPPNKDIQDEQFLTKIEKGIEQREMHLAKIFQQYPKNTEVTLVLGMSGSGKSTVISYHAEDQLIGYLDLDQIHIKRKPETIAQDNVPDQIGAGYTSRTSLPYLRTGWFDCPGFFDTRGPEDEILNGYSVAKLLDNYSKVRFLLAINDSDLNPGSERAELFLQAIKKFDVLTFGTPINNLKKGLNIIVTQGAHDDVSIFKMKVNRILTARQNELTTSQQEILKYMCSEENSQISFFTMPKEEGVIKKNLKLISDKAEYIDDIRSNITFSHEAEKHIKAIANRTTRRVTDCLENFYENLPNQSLKFIQSHDGDAQKIRAVFQSMIKPLKEVHSEELTLDSDTQNIENVLKQLNPASQETFSALIAQRRTLKKIKPKEVTLSFNLNKGGILDNLAGRFTHLSKLPVPKLNGSSFTLEGNVIGMSDLVHHLIGKGGVLMADVYCKHSLLIDKDVEKPNTSMVLAAPHWIVRGQKILSLRGNDGEEIMQPQAPYSQNGLPGNPGHSGGNFYGIMDEIYNGSGLKIDVSGGTGGKGQTGGDGIKGIDGEEGSLEDIINRRESALAAPKETLKRGFLRWALTSNDAERLLYRSGKLGTKGGDAGAGGKGGYGGKSGTVEFERLENGKFQSLLTGVEYQKDEGRDGPDGEHGVPGQGGLNKPIYEGVCIKKKRNMTELAKRVVTDGVAGAGTGASIGWLGGPFGIGIGAIGGAVIGGISPIIGSEIDKRNWLWEQGPEQMDGDQWAQPGKKAQHVNDEKIRKPSDSATINYVNVRLNWKGFIKSLWYND